MNTKYLLLKIASLTLVFISSSFKPDKFISVTVKSISSDVSSSISLNYLFFGWKSESESLSIYENLIIGFFNNEMWFLESIFFAIQIIFLPNIVLLN